MKSKLFTIGIILFCLQANGQSSSTIPRLAKNGNSVQLLVDNKPFLIFGRGINGDQDHQGRHVRIPGNEYSIQL